MHSRILAAVAVLFAAACGPMGKSLPPVSTAPTFHKDVQPILQGSCQSCHVSGGIAPFPLMTYADAQAYAPLIAQQTGSKTMPPWDAVGTPDCQPRLGFQGDPRLTDAQIQTLADWNGAGAPEGNPADAPPPLAPTPTDLPGVTMTLQPSTPFVASGQTDEFRCFVLDPKLTTAQYLNGYFVVPGNRAVVHHAVLFSDPTGASKALADSSGGYDCFGGPNVPNPLVLGVWTPGGVPFEMPANIATPVQAGSLMVMQIHYHPHGQVGVAADTTRVQLRFTSVIPQYALLTTGVGNFAGPLPGGDGLQPDPANPSVTPQFVIPANVAGHPEEMILTLPANTPPLSLFGAMAHMHLIGTDQEVFIEHAATATSPASEECVLHEPRWNFDWQRFYLYDATQANLPTLRAGDKIKVRCLYDNTTANPGVQRLLSDTGRPAPFDVTLGEQTTNEMCIALLPVLLAVP